MFASRTAAICLAALAIGTTCSIATAQYLEVESSLTTGFYIQGSRYSASSGVTFLPGPQGSPELSINSLNLIFATEAGDLVPLPAAGQTATYTCDECLGPLDPDDDADGVVMEFAYTPPGSGQRIAIEEEGVKQHFSNLSRPSGGPEGMYAVELTELEFDFLLDDGSTILFRESPALVSTGEHVITPISSDLAGVSSFFDLYLEASYDDGAQWHAASGPLSMSLVRVIPEPSSALLAAGAMAIVAYKLRQQGGAA